MGMSVFDFEDEAESEKRVPLIRTKPPAKTTPRKGNKAPRKIPSAHLYQTPAIEIKQKDYVMMRMPEFKLRYPFLKQFQLLGKIREAWRKELDRTATPQSQEKHVKRKNKIDGNSSLPVQAISKEPKKRLETRIELDEDDEDFQVETARLTYSNRLSLPTSFNSLSIKSSTPQSKSKAPEKKGCLKKTSSVKENVPSPKFGDIRASSPILEEAALTLTPKRLNSSRRKDSLQVSTPKRSHSSKQRVSFLKEISCDIFNVTPSNKSKNESRYQKTNWINAPPENILPEPAKTKSDADQEVPQTPYRTTRAKSKIVQSAVLALPVFSRQRSPSPSPVSSPTSTKSLLKQVLSTATLPIFPRQRTPSPTPLPSPESTQVFPKQALSTATIQITINRPRKLCSPKNGAVTEWDEKAKSVLRSYGPEPSMIISRLDQKF